MNHPFSKIDQCIGCKVQVTGFLHRQFSENGAETFTWICGSCGRKGCFGVLFIAKETVYKNLTPEQIELLPVIMPNLNGRCVICGARGVEWHHWAPKAIFGAEESGKWPGDWLCKTHHDLWHRMVTPQLVL